MPTLEELLERIDELTDTAERLEEPIRGHVFELLEGVHALYRMALARLAESLGSERVEQLIAADPAVHWLLEDFEADERHAAENAVADVVPYIHSHGGELEVLRARAGVVTVRLSGACSGCTASAITLRRGVEEALRERLPGFVALEVEEVAGDAHPPPGPTLLQIEGIG